MRAIVFVGLSLGLFSASTFAEDEPPLTMQWKVLHRSVRPSANPRPLPPTGPIRPLTDFQFTGPNPAHPFILGNFATDGQFGVVAGGIQRVSGNNAAIRLCGQAEHFEIEGHIHAKDVGGWFLLLGWNDEFGNGYALHNVALKESGAPWFLTEFRGRKAIDDTTQRLREFEWNRPQDVTIRVVDKQLTFQLGASKVIDGEMLANYQPGQIIFGVYDTRYGPRPIRIESLRIRAVEPSAAEPSAADN